MAGLSTFVLGYNSGLEIVIADIILGIVIEWTLSN